MQAYFFMVFLPDSSSKKLHLLLKKTLTFFKKQMLIASVLLTISWKRPDGKKLFFRKLLRQKNWQKLTIDLARRD